MKRKDNIFARIFIYASTHPLAFLGFSCWGGLIPLAFLDGALGLDLPGWFISFIIFLGFVFFGLSYKYDTKA
tara:strand:+ start:386 stop:601 length:216 start_codon:yes stop_codon:yes gene_type:complete